MKTLTCFGILLFVSVVMWKAVNDWVMAVTYRVAVECVKEK